MTFVNFAQLQSSQETHKDVPCKAWNCKVRLQKLPAYEVLRLLDFQGDDDSEELEHVDAMRFGIELVVASVTDENNKKQFDSGEGRRFLSLEFDALQELVPQIKAFQGLGGNGEAKKNG